MLTVSSLAKKIHGTVEGDVDFKINGVGDLRTSPKNFVSFLSDERYYKFFEDSSSNVVIVNNKFNNPQKALHAASKIGEKIIMKKGAIVNVK